MSAAATIPFTAPQQKSQPWSPTDRDRLVFRWVKFEGYTQSWVASQLELSQSSVSRIVDRYERWIARGGPSQQGAPNHDERLRTQRWLTYERNEWILCSALRLAGEMEHGLDTSKSVIRRPVSSPSAESEVRTEHKRIDRSGLAARYLRLAHRINMDQLQLVEQEPLPALDPLTIEDLGDDDVCHGHSARADRDDEANPSIDPSNLPSGLAETDEPTAPPQSDAEPLTSDLRPLTSKPDSQPPVPRPEPPILDPAAVTTIEITPNASPVHKTHKPQGAKSTLTPNHKPTSTKQHSPKKRSADAYAAVAVPPETTTDHFRQTSDATLSAANPYP